MWTQTGSIVLRGSWFRGGGEEWCRDKPNAKCEIYQRAERCCDFQFNFQITAVRLHGELFGLLELVRELGRLGGKKIESEVIESQGVLNGLSWVERCCYV